MISYASINLDAWMPYYGDDFDSATKMWSREMRMSYLDCLWHYWSHTKCMGLPNDDEMLRRLCGCELREWVRTKGVLFGGRPFFYLRHGRWHQDRARKERAERLRICRLNMHKTFAATRARNAKRDEQRNKERDEQRDVGRNDERGRDVTGDVAALSRPTLQSPSHSHSHSQIKGSPPSTPALSKTDAIKFEKELVRIGKELAELGSVNDHATGSKKRNRIMELQARQVELRKVLGVTA